MPDSVEIENKAKQRAAKLSVLSNLILTTGKLVIGIVTGSVSIISEGIHSGMDLLASCIAFFSVRKSSRPPDNKHAFGYGKYEDASGLIEALLIIVAAGIIIWEAIEKLIWGGNSVNFDTLHLGLIIMGVSALMNFCVSQYLMHVAKKTESIALETDAWHLRTDVLTSAGVFAGLILIQITHIEWIDSVIAIVVAVFILREAYVLIRRSFADLMDESLSSREIEKIDEIISRHENQFTNYHSLRTRKGGPNKFISFHLLMPRNQKLIDSHTLIDHIEKEIKSEIPRAVVISHLDPCDGRCGCDTCTFVCKKERRNEEDQTCHVSKKQ